MAAIVLVLSRRGALAGRAAARAARARLEHRTRTDARRLDDLAGLVRLYGSLEAYDEEQRRCGLHQLEAQLRLA
jgi:hypothetical protein